MHRDLWLSLFGAVAGTVIGYLAAMFRPEARFHWAIVLALVPWIWSSPRAVLG